MSTYTPHTSVRRTDPGTSHIAAFAAQSFAGSQCEKIHSALKAHGPMDAETIGEMLGLDAYQVRKRLSNLEQADPKLAEPTGEIVPSAAGRTQRVWRAL